MSDQENKEKKYIRYTAEELATVPSPYQMERELEQVCQEYGLGFSQLMDIESEYRLLRALGAAGYAAQRRLERAARHRHHHP